ncbi:hypothetical protein KSP39_PZI012088 [Platanthera zijinensis]|uniref:Mitochondrial import inner membrane translocase subunit TIM50 n=1 Tax=Platanthera zijinensis TaxID=2320716 RepID=A0AAP0G4W1_9ASPA
MGKDRRNVSSGSGSEPENVDENSKLHREGNINTSKVFQSEKEMVHRNPKRIRMCKLRRKAKFRMFIREDDLAVHVRTTQAVEIFEAPRKNVDSALDNQKNTKMRRGRRSRKRWKEYRCHIQHMEQSLRQLQTNNGSNYFSVLRLRKRRNSSENTDKQKIKSLIVEDHHNHNTGSSCFHDSIFHEDDTDVLALKNIYLLDKERGACSVQPERALGRTFRKKLLVLDLNGILCDVVFSSCGSRMPYKKVSKKPVFKRPFLDDFMAFCFEKFAVGIWSSRNKKNVAGVINYIMCDTKDKLLFSWDQSKCTLTGFNTIKERYKPLVLKELIKLWDKEEAALPWEKGDYSPSNTLLVDDSPYKALCNPPNTAIFPFSYDFRDEGDNFLAPGGAFRIYLENIAMADDVQEHVKEHSFGQLAITSADEKWSFYKNIIDKHNSMALTL